MTDPLTAALADLEATLARVWEEADREYEARHYPWHQRTPGCDDAYGDHVHGPGRIIYYPDAISVDRPNEEPT